MAKSLMMAGQGAGFDMTRKEGSAAYMIAYNAGLIPDAAGRLATDAFPDGWPPPDGTDWPSAVDRSARRQPPMTTTRPKPRRKGKLPTPAAARIVSGERRCPRQPQDPRHARIHDPGSPGRHDIRRADRPVAGRTVSAAHRHEVDRAGAPSSMPSSKSTPMRWRSPRRWTGSTRNPAPRAAARHPDPAQRQHRHRTIGCRPRPGRWRWGARSRPGMRGGRAELREAGAVILGKTNLSEWANFRVEPLDQRLEQPRRTDEESLCA